MKKAIMIVGALAVWGGPAGPVHGQTAAAGQTAPQESKADYARRIRAELDRIKTGIERKDQAAARALKNKAKAAERSLNRLEKAGEKDWNGLKSRVEKSMEDLRKAVHDLA